MPASNLPDTIALTEEYIRSVELQYQERTAKLFAAVRGTDQQAESKFANYIGTIEFQPIVVANGDTVLQSPAHTRRRVVVHREGAGVPLDEDYDFHAVTDLGGPYMEALYAGAGRLVDSTIYTALGGAAYTGKQGLTTVNNYDSGECRLIDGDGSLVTAGSDHSNTTETALTVAKIQLIQELFTNASVPEELRYFLVNQYNINQMIVTSTWGAEEALAIRDLQEGKMKRLLGFNWIIKPDSFFTDNPTDTACIECYAWQKSAVLFSRGQGKKMPRILVGPRPDKNYMIQFWADMWVGATRLRGPGVVEILLQKQAA